MNFTFDLLYCNHKWGTKQPNGSWDGIVGAIAEGVKYNNYYFITFIQF